MNTPSVLAQPRADILTVTPGMAKEWLARNTHNRNIRKRDVANYARDMAAGMWLMNGEAVKFAADGTLLDGQHRLHGVIAADAAVQMLVITGLPSETQSTMDSGKKRTTADALGLQGNSNAAVLAAVLKKIWMWEQGDFKFTNTVPTTAECAALLAERKEIHRSVEIAARIQTAFGCIPQSSTGTAHYLFSQIDGPEAVWFFARIGDGAELPVGHPILTLRTRALRERSERTQTVAWRHMAYLIRTWNAVREGRSLTRILQDPDAPMPMPK